MKQLIFKEIDDLIIDSLGIVSFISFFVGGVVAIQTALNLTNPLIPKYLIGFATRQSVVLEFAPTFISIIMAGKMGSFITSSIGTMRVTEQIDALDVMGINSANFLILPKIIACVFFNPLLVMISIGFGLLGGYYIGVFTKLWSAADFITGLQMNMATKLFVYTFLKTMVFAFVIATIPAYYGYKVTTAVVWTSVAIIVINLILTQTILS
jgi:phospholipid/cholesterol/gamma-HCH transport system permease protein